MKRQNSNLIIALIILSILVIGLGSYLIINKVLKNKNDTNNSKAYSVLMSDVCSDNGECSVDLDDISLGDNNYTVSVQLYGEQSESWANGKTDSITINNQKIDTNESFIRFLAVMDNEYLIIGTNWLAPADVYTLEIFNKDLTLVETIHTYLQGEEAFNLNRDILDNNTTLLYYDCSMEELVTDEQNPQKLTTYSVKFANGTFNKTPLNVVHNTFCSAEM